MKVELSVHALKLKNVAGAFKGTSDPFAVVTQIAATPGERPRVIGKTEVVKNSLNPQWVTSFTLDYEMGMPLKVAVNIFDEVRKGDNKTMGSAVFEIGEVLGTCVCVCVFHLSFIFLILTLAFSSCSLSTHTQEPVAIPRPRN